MDEKQRQQALGELWATAYDCWVNAPGSQGPIYTSPQPADSSELGTNQWPETVRNLALPIFGMTAYNPCGNDQTVEENLKANASLEKDLVELSSKQADASTTTWWHGFGFGESWHEKGFVVSTHRHTALELAKKYSQGAIYEYSFLKEEPSIVLRRTIPVLVPNVEADVRVMTVAQPPFATSNPDYLQ